MEEEEKSVNSAPWLLFLICVHLHTQLSSHVFIGDPFSKPRGWSDGRTHKRQTHPGNKEKEKESRQHTHTRMHRQAHASENIKRERNRNR